MTLFGHHVISDVYTDVFIIKETITSKITKTCNGTTYLFEGINGGLESGLVKNLS